MLVHVHIFVTRAGLLDIWHVENVSSKIQLRGILKPLSCAKVNPTCMDTTPHCAGVVNEQTFL